MSPAEERARCSRLPQTALDEESAPASPHPAPISAQGAKNIHSHPPRTPGPRAPRAIRAIPARIAPREILLPRAPHRIRTASPPQSPHLILRSAPPSLETTAHLRDRKCPRHPQAQPSPAPSARPRNTAPATRDTARQAAFRLGAAIPATSLSSDAASPSARSRRSVAIPTRRMSPHTSANPCGVSDSTSGIFGSLVNAVAKSSGEAAHTWQRSCVTIKSGASFASSSASTA